MRRLDVEIAHSQPQESQINNKQLHLNEASGAANTPSVSYLLPLWTGPTSYTTCNGKEEEDLQASVKVEGSCVYAPLHSSLITAARTGLNSERRDPHSSI